jgi:hypothetical protein
MALACNASTIDNHTSTIDKGQEAAAFACVRDLPKAGEPNVREWNQIGKWLSELDALRGCGLSRRTGSIFTSRSAPRTRSR